MSTIPEEILTKIEVHRPHLSTLCARVRAARTPWTIRRYERTLADAYLRLSAGPLSAAETNALASCSVGEPYGGAHLPAGQAGRKTA